MHQLEKQQTGIPQSQLLNVLLAGDFSILDFIGIKTEFTLLNLYNVNLMFVSKQTSVIFIAYAKGCSHSFTRRQQHLEIFGDFVGFSFSSSKKYFKSSLLALRQLEIFM